MLLILQLHSEESNLHVSADHGLPAFINIYPWQFMLFECFKFHVNGPRELQMLLGF